jgi:hypothetical protein
LVCVRVNAAACAGFRQNKKNALTKRAGRVSKHRFISPKTVASLKGGATPYCARDHRHDEQYDEDEEQDLCDSRGCACNAAKTKGGSD